MSALLSIAGSFATGVCIGTALVKGIEGVALRTGGKFVLLCAILAIAGLIQRVAA